MVKKSGTKILAMPGPTNVPEEVIQAMNRPAIDIYSGEAVNITKSCLADLKHIFRTKFHTFVFASNGHGVWEAALSNLFSSGDTVLIPVCGHFPVSWSYFAKRLGVKVEFLEAANERAANDPKKLKAALDADKKHKIKAVLQVHIDTASSVVNDLASIRQAIDDAKHPALLVVDAIASLGIVPLEMDDWGIDVVIAASQKGLMMTPGLGFIATNEKALHISKKTNLKSGYWDWHDRQDEPHYKKYCGTAPVHLMMGLRKSLNLMLEETMETIWIRHARLAEAVRRAIDVWATKGELSFNVIEKNQRSNAVTTVLLRDGINPEILTNYCRQNLCVILGIGIGTFEGRSFRIAHMGYLNEAMIFGIIGTVEIALKSLSIPHGSGGVQAAIDYLATGPHTGNFN